METKQHISAKGIRHYSLVDADSLLCGKWLPLPHPELPDGTEVRDCKTCKRLLAEQGPMITIPITHEMNEHLRESARVNGVPLEDVAVTMLKVMLRRHTLPIEDLRKLPTAVPRGVAYTPEPVKR